MDQKKNTQGQQSQGQNQGQSNPDEDRQPNQNPPDKTRGKQEDTRGERNLGGISNRGLSEDEEQADLPRRGSTSDESFDDLDDQSDR